MLKNAILFILTVIMLTPASGQKVTETDNQLWFGAFNQTRFSERWGFWADGHYRMKGDFVDDFGLFIIRGGPMFYLTDDVRITAAYGYIGIGPEGTRTITQPEHRPWQQVQWFVRRPQARLIQAIRLEERFRRRIEEGSRLGDGYDYNPRLRYNFSLFLPLTKKKFAPGGLQFLLNNEVMFNFGKNIIYNHFDQNRFFAGLVYQVNPQVQIQAGYLNVYIQLPAGNVFRNQHNARIFYVHNLDFRKKEN